MDDAFFIDVLQRPGTIMLPSNRVYVDHWKESGGRVIVQSTGHLVFYGSDGRRFLQTDPEGHPLHECEWATDAQGHFHLVAARMSLEWGQWVGIKPEGLTHRRTLDLTVRPGWESLTRDDLREMAARAMNVSLDQMRWFYADEDLQLHSSGQATIRQRKDAFYVLRNGAFEHSRFMSCMSRMNWGCIDYLPVVELFLSLLPGTGSATFELIRALYDDQNPDDPRALTYRGIPTYPSKGAFGLFSQFFTPSVSGGGDPLPVFLDPTRSHEVAWLPAPDPPVRYVDPVHQLCLTVKKGAVQKATLADDPTGLFYYNPAALRLASCGRHVTVQHNHLLLSDEDKCTEIPLQSSWQISHFSSESRGLECAPSWRDMFPEGPPVVTPKQAFGCVLLYPENDTIIGEPESQPFVINYFEDLLDGEPSLQAHLTHTNRVLIYQCDAALGSCFRLDRQREYHVVYDAGAFAQKCAQQLWNQLAQHHHLEWIQKIRLYPKGERSLQLFQKTFDLLYVWSPFAGFLDVRSLEQWMRLIAGALNPGGIGFVAGPPILSEYARRFNLFVLDEEQALALPTFRLHQAILPEAQLNPDLMVYVFQQAGATKP